MFCKPGNIKRSVDMVKSLIEIYDLQETQTDMQERVDFQRSVFQ